MRKKVAVLGLGIEGLSLVKYFSKKCDVLVVDEKQKSQLDSEILKEAETLGAKFYFGRIKNLPKVDIIARSPGINVDHPIIKLLSHSKTEHTSATNIFFKKFKGNIIGVTGTKGKGTTSTLTTQILKNHGLDAKLAGNIGIPMLSLLKNSTGSSIAVLELSSFQLIDISKSPHIAVVLMTTSEHLDWHTNQKEYLLAKSNIIRFQKDQDFAVINKDFPNSVEITKGTKAKRYFFSTKKETNGVYIKNGKFISAIGSNGEVCSTSDVQLPGIHNLQNVAAAIAVAKILEIPNVTIADTVKKFKGLEHRLQFVAVKKGIFYYNDSFSTTPETTIAAIDSFDNPKIVIIGGSSKKSDFTALINKLSQTSTIKYLILIGSEGARINSLIGNKIPPGMIITGLTSMSEIVAKCHEISKPGDVVLLSPACASFDMFKNYKDRGEQFIKVVNSL